jgi:hypothetical protein
LPLANMPKEDKQNSGKQKIRLIPLNHIQQAISYLQEL